MTSTLIPSAFFSVQPARNARHVRGSRKGMSGGTMKRWSALYGYRVLISHGVTMERLRQKYREVGVEERPLTDEQKTSIAEVRRFYQAKVAERESLHRDALAKARSREEVEKLDGALRHDLERLTGDRDRKIDEIKKRPPTEH